MGLKRFLRFLNSEGGQLPASEAARFDRAEESFTQAPLPADGGQLFRVLNPDLSITETATPSVGDVLIDPFGQPFGRFNSFFAGDAIGDIQAALGVPVTEDDLNYFYLETGISF